MSASDLIAAGLAREEDRESVEAYLTAKRRLDQLLLPIGDSGDGHGGLALAHNLANRARRNQEWVSAVRDCTRVVLQALPADEARGLDVLLTRVDSSSRMLEQLAGAVEHAATVSTELAGSVGAVVKCLNSLGYGDRA